MMSPRSIYTASGRNRLRSVTACVWMLVLSSVVCIAGCGKGTPVLHVYAASSLTDAFGDLSETYQREHPEVNIAVTHAGSQVLRLQIEQGAPADVYASANVEHMQALTQAGLVPYPKVFVRNAIALIVPQRNPAEIETIADLPSANRLVIGTEQAPVGRYARRAIAQGAATLGEDFPNRVMDKVVSEESNARLIRAKVEMGEADAALVYQTDAATSRRIIWIPVPAAMNVEVEYTMGVVAGSRNSGYAGAWLDLVQSRRGQEVLARHGFVVR